MECRLGWINTGSFAGIVGLRSPLVAANVGWKPGVNAGRVDFKCRSLVCHECAGRELPVQCCIEDEGRSLGIGV